MFRGFLLKMKDIQELLEYLACIEPQIRQNKRQAYLYDDTWNTATNQGALDLIEILKLKINSNNESTGDSKPTN